MREFSYQVIWWTVRQLTKTENLVSKNEIYEMPNQLYTLRNPFWFMHINSVRGGKIFQSLIGGF